MELLHCNRDGVQAGSRQAAAAPPADQPDEKAAGVFSHRLKHGLQFKKIYLYGMPAAWAANLRFIYNPRDSLLKCIRAMRTSERNLLFFQIEQQRKSLRRVSSSEAG